MTRQNSKRRNPVKNALRIVGKVLGWTLLVLLALVLVLYVFLQTGPGRRLVKNQVETRVNGAIQGRIAIGELASLGLGQVRIQQFTLFDTQDRPVLNVADLVVKPSLWDILRGRIEIAQIAIVEPHVDLSIDETGRYRLLTAIAGTSTPKPEKPPVEEGEPTSIRIREFTLEGGRLTTDDPSARGLRLEDITIRSELEIGRGIAVDLDELSFKVFSDQGELLRLDPSAAHIETRAGATSTASLQITSEYDQIDLRAEMVWPSDTTPMSVDASLEFSPLTTRLMEPLGLNELRQSLPEWIGGELTARGPLDDLQVSGRLETEGGRVILDGQVNWPDQVSITTTSPELQLHELAGNLPRMSVSWQLSAAMQLEDGVRHVSLDLAQASLDERSIPPLNLQATQDSQGIRLSRLQLVQFGDDLELSGRMPTDGPIEFALRADHVDLGSNRDLQTFVPGLEGVLDGSLDATLELGAPPRVEVEMDLSMENASVADNSVRAFHVSGTAQGHLSAPDLDLHVRAEQLISAAVTVQRADIRATGDPDSYRLSGEVRLADGPLADFDLRAALNPRQVVVDGSIDAAMEGESARLELQQVALEFQRAIRAGTVRMTHRDSEIRISGTYDFEAGAAIEASVERFDLAVFDGRLGLPDLPIGGIVTADVAFHGQPRRPRVALLFDWSDGYVGPVRQAGARMDLNYGPDGLLAEGNVNLGRAARLDVDASADFEQTDDLLADLTGAQYEVSLNVRADDLGLLHQLLPSSPVTDGSMRGEVRIDGTWTSPSIEADLSGVDTEIARQPPFDWRTGIASSERELRASFIVSDDFTDLVRLRLSADVGPARLLQGNPLDLLRDTTWQAEVYMAQRRIDDLGVSLGPLGDLPVLVALDAELRGSPEQPPTGQVEARAEVLLEQSEHPWADCPTPRNLGLTVTAQLSGDETQVELVTRLGDRSVIRLDAQTAVTLAQLLSTMRLSGLGEVDANLRVDDLPLESLPFACNRIGGSLDGTLTADDLFSSTPVVELDLTGRSLVVADRPPMTLQTELDLDNERLGMTVDTSDEVGTIAIIEADAEIGLEALMAGALQERLDESSWQVALRMPERFASTLGIPMGPLQEVPTRLSFDGRLSNRPGQGPTGRVELNLVVDSRWDEELSQRCQGEEELALDLETHLNSDGAALSLDAMLGDAQVLQVDASAPVRLEDWLFGEPPQELPPIDATLLIETLELARLPAVCNEATGRLDGRFALQDLFGADPTLEIQLTGEAVSLLGGVPMDLTSDMTAGDGRAFAHFDVDAGQGGRMDLNAQVPIRWDSQASVPGLGTGSIETRLSLTEFTTDTLTGLVPMLRRSNGRLDGSVTLEGPLDGLMPRGEIEFHDLVLTVPGLDQRLTDLSGRIVLSDEQLRLEQVRARDHHGTVQLQGQVQWVALSPTRAEVELQAETFPMRQAGSTAAYLTTRANLRADISDERLDASVVLREVAIRLPAQIGRSVQSLAVNPDIVFAEEVTEFVFEEEPVATQATSIRPIRVHVDATSPFWVRRSDFAIQLSADLVILVDQQGVRISGQVDLRRGTLDLLSKTFEIERGSIYFDGGSQIDPILDIVALHPLSRYPGENVSIAILGRLSRPELTFASTVPGVENESQIIQLLVSGRVSEEQAASDAQAGDQVASFLGGLTGGILTLVARNALGDTLPVISVQTGEDLGDVQVRAGFAADRLIPSFLRDIVTGVYVEGFVETQSADEETGTEGRTTGGFLFELYFPFGFLTSTSFQPPANWSLDVLWQQ